MTGVARGGPRSRGRRATHRRRGRRSTLVVLQARRGAKLKRDAEWVAPMSAKAKRTANPIRALVDDVVRSASGPRTDGKDRIPLSLGDPTVFGNLPPCEVLLNKVGEEASKGGYAGYVDARGSPEARRAIAKASSWHVLYNGGCRLYE